MWVKICANTSREDALGAAESGADAVGFVFAPSRRQVSVTQVAAISGALPAGVERVGVFAGSPPEQIAAAAREAGLTAVQLHDGLDLEMAGRLRALLDREIRLIHTIHWTLGDTDEAARQASAAFQRAQALPAGDRLLLDAKAGSSSGGLGRAYDHAAAARVLAGAGSCPVIVAGGLHPGNVREAVRVMRPYGVDVASGVEEMPGKKDWDKVRQFILNARKAEMESGAGSGTGR